MDRKQKSISVIIVAVMLIAITSVTANSLAINTPLYALRMEQASSKMSFLPTERNIFTYTTENGFDLNYSGTGECCGAVSPLDTGVWTCYYSTCGGDTCYLTCPESCYGTCTDPTCVTCQGQNTCWATCPSTCEDSCGGTCEGRTCEETLCYCPP
ncbi:MAG: hypothetical protein HXS54_05750 [Theionarchaea archaeon]|nr:hypothetical protein [Theionarchaea archaeon]